MTPTATDILFDDVRELREQVTESNRLLSAVNAKLAMHLDHQEIRFGMVWQQVKLQWGAIAALLLTNLGLLWRG